MSPRECLLDRIEELRVQALAAKPDGDVVVGLMSEIRVYFAGVGATHCPPPKQTGISAGTIEQAERLYR